MGAAARRRRIPRGACRSIATAASFARVSHGRSRRGVRYDGWRARDASGRLLLRRRIVRGQRIARHLRHHRSAPGRLLHAGPHVERARASRLLRRPHALRQARGGHPGRAVSRAREEQRDARSLRAESIGEVGRALGLRRSRERSHAPNRRSREGHRDVRAHRHDRRPLRADVALEPVTIAYVRAARGSVLRRG